MSSYEAFISYSHADAKWAAWLHRSIETYRVPKRLIAARPELRLPARLTPIFRDREELPTAVDLGQKIEEALAASKCLIVVCSPRAAASHWVNEEIRRFKALGRGDRIFAIVVDGEPNAASRGHDPTSECFPDELRADADHVAADARPHADGRRNAQLKVVAGMLGVGLDDLKRRELQRRNRRLAWLATGSVIAVMFTSALAVFALLARNEAEANRARAEREAQTARATTQFMVELFDVVDPGEARGRSITAYEILERGVGRIDTSLSSEPEVQATLLETMGKVFTGLGLFQRSMELLDRALRARGSAPAELTTPTKVALANAQYLAGRYDEAEALYREVVASFPDASAWTFARSDAASGLAEVLTQKEALTEAVALYRGTLARDVEAWGPHDVHVARTANGLATALLYSGDTDGAEASYRQALDAYREALGADHPKVAETISNLGAVHYFVGDLAGAAEFYKQALPLYRKLYGASHPEVAGVLNNLGRIELERLDIAAATAMLEESVSIDRSLGREDHDDFIFALQSLGIAYQESGRLSDAERLLSEAEALAARYKHRLWGPILVSRAELLCATKRAGDAEALLNEAAQLIHAAYATEPWRMAILDSVRGYCMAKSGDASGRILLRDSLPEIQSRWGDESLFTRDARKRIAEAHADRRQG